MLTDELLLYIFNEQPHPLAHPITTWLASSRRFANFVTTFRDKIRKKLRVTQDPEGLLDLRLELETAYLLLRERTLNLVYEPQPPGQLRGPDYAVSFTTSLTFMLEVTRLRAEPKNTQAALQEQTPTSSIISERLVDVICSKLGQLAPQRTNVLLVGVETLHLTQSDLRVAMVNLQQRAERNDRTFLYRHRFRDRADFFHHYQRLSEILVRGPQLPTTESLAVWVNPQAKQPLPSKVRTALYRSHTI